MKKYLVSYLFRTIEIEAADYAAAFAWHEANHPSWDLQGIHEVGDKFSWR